MDSAIRAALTRISQLLLSYFPGDALRGICVQSPLTAIQYLVMTPVNAVAALVFLLPISWFKTNCTLRFQEANFLAEVRVTCNEFFKTLSKIEHVSPELRLNLMLLRYAHVTAPYASADLGSSIFNKLCTSSKRYLDKMRAFRASTDSTLQLDDMLSLWNSDTAQIICGNFET